MKKLLYSGIILATTLMAGWLWELVGPGVAAAQVPVLGLAGIALAFAALGTLKACDKLQGGAGFITLRRQLGVWFYIAIASGAAATLSGLEEVAAVSLAAILGGALHWISLLMAAGTSGTNDRDLGVNTA